MLERLSLLRQINVCQTQKEKRSDKQYQSIWHFNVDREQFHNPSSPKSCVFSMRFCPKGKMNCTFFIYSADYYLHFWVIPFF